MAGLVVGLTVHTDTVLPSFIQTRLLHGIEGWDNRGWRESWGKNEGEGETVAKQGCFSGVGLCVPMAVQPTNEIGFGTP